MNPVNQNHIPLPRLREIFRKNLPDVINDDNLAQIDIALNAPNGNFKLLHHLLIARYSKVRTHHRKDPINVIGLDIETEYTTGEPRLLGFSYPDGFYHIDENPSLLSLYHMLHGIMDNRSDHHIVTWGNLDINCIIRIFSPTDDEQKRISRGISGHIERGVIKTPPPVLRQIDDRTSIYIDHYVSGRSLRIGILHNQFSQTIWFFNLSQFFPMRIAEAAKGFGFPWKDFDRDTHLVNWGNYYDDSNYRKLVRESNKQDAETVRTLAVHLQKIFYRIFGAYPGLLVSTGSLADAAVSKLLDEDEYKSNSWRYLRYGVWKDSPYVDTAEAMLSEAFSAGYVDQFAIGYFPEIHTADISSAYPHKIRELPDLRYCRLFAGKGNPDKEINRLKEHGYEFFTAVIRGKVFIPEHLKFHPITVKTSQRQNIRPTGTFNATYMYEERDFCNQWGARFTDEEFVLFMVKPNVPSAIAKVSNMLADMRHDYRMKMRHASNDSESLLYDSMQERVKVIDNSLYGKTVMTTPIVAETSPGKVEITGLKAGDRYNQLYGCVITARTRVQLADACMEIAIKGGKPILAMTDSLYWVGSADMLPKDIQAKEKIAGLFETPTTVYDFYLIKTGQYEYRCASCKAHPHGGFHHKMRGFNLPFEDRDSSRSFYHDLIKGYAATASRYAHPEDVEIPIATRKLATIGVTNDLERLGKVEDGETIFRPFVMSGKQVEPYMMQWRKAIDGALWLETPCMSESKSMPMEFLSNLHETRADHLTKYERKKMFYYLIFKVTGKSAFPGRRLNDLSYEQLENWSGVKREWCNL